MHSGSRVRGYLVRFMAQPCSSLFGLVASRLYSFLVRGEDEERSPA